MGYFFVLGDSVRHYCILGNTIRSAVNVDVRWCKRWGLLGVADAFSTVRVNDVG